MEVQEATRVMKVACVKFAVKYIGTVELEWLEHLLDHETRFETGLVGADEC